MKKILIIAAHPDDEILGCAGTVARMINEGCTAATIILGEGKTSRDEQRDAVLRKDELQVLNNEIIAANKAIGIEQVYVYNFPDNRFDGVDLLDIVKVIEKVKNEFKPDVIFTHFYNDLNIDHQITYKAVSTAIRPMADETVKEVYCFEVLSSTEWNYPLTFSPELFFDISNTIDIKVNAMKAYTSELREFPHPRSLEGIRLNAKTWGMKVGVPYAEAFKVIRIVK